MTSRLPGVAALWPWPILTGFDPVEKLAACKPDLIIRDLGSLQRVLEAAGQSQFR